MPIEFSFQFCPFVLTLATCIFVYLDSELREGERFMLTDWQRRKKLDSSSKLKFKQQQQHQWSLRQSMRTAAAGNCIVCQSSAFSQSIIEFSRSLLLPAFLLAPSLLISVVRMLIKLFIDKSANRRDKAFNCWRRLTEQHCTGQCRFRCRANCR